MENEYLKYCTPNQDYLYIRMHDIDLEVDWYYETEHNETGKFKTVVIRKVELNGLDVTQAFTGELLENLIEMIEAVG